MPAFNKTQRAPAFGVYSGCPCTIQLQKGISTTDRTMPDSEFKRIVDDLIAEWKRECPEFVPGPRIGGGIHQNWNKKLKMQYGKWIHINCTYDESAIAFGGGRYCKLSLKEKENDKAL
jgi:hypothetical protein